VVGNITLVPEKYFDRNLKGNKRAIFVCRSNDEHHWGVLDHFGAISALAQHLPNLM
jgi:hypothetical protein